MESFFQSDHMQQKLKQSIISIKSLAQANRETIEYQDLIVSIINEIISSPSEWDLYCSYNVGKNQSEFNNVINVLIKNSKNSRTNIISTNDGKVFDSNINQFFEFSLHINSFFIEYYISVDKADSDDKLEKMNAQMLSFIDDIPERYKNKAQGIIRNTPIEILKSVLANSHIKNIKDVSSLAAESEQTFETWHEEIKEKEGRVNAIKDSLDEYKNAFNFVGLNEGFHDLLEDKKTEIGRLVWWVRASAFFMIAPVLYELVLIYEMAKTSSEPTGMGLFFALPAISLVVIATYFFRVLLSNYKGVKSQISQLELRMTLCRFIQSYAEYSSELKEKNGSTLEKFEDIVFSNIFANDDTAISAFDGIEQFSKLVDKIKR
ncbi:hypothetical protein [Marinomonas primoryensis]|uniref:hypothetical protein n=1 Tax=Marinomonas primoryensis TaxID=178399 RepID=UPI003704C399